MRALPQRTEGFMAAGGLEAVEGSKNGGGEVRGGSLAAQTEACRGRAVRGGPGRSRTAQ